MKLDSYTIKARLCPSIVLVIPILVLGFTLLSVPFSMVNLVPEYITTCACLIIAIFVRNRGKSIEPRLWKSWGGPPTTRYLRYNNNEYNSINRDRCHQYFLRNIPDISFPSRKFESENPIKADEVYEACITFLRTKSRDKKKYALVYSENIEYGFLRNSLGVKAIGITFSLLTLLISISIITIYWKNFQILILSLFLPITLSFLILIYWIFFVTKRAVKCAAENYAVRLLEICLEG